MVAIVSKVLAVAEFKLPSCKGSSAVLAGWQGRALSVSFPPPKASGCFKALEEAGKLRWVDK